MRPSATVSPGLGLIAASIVIAVAGCGGSSEVTSATVASTPVGADETPAATQPTTPTATDTPATTAVPSTTSPTTEPPTTEPPSTTVPPTTAPPASTAPPTTAAAEPAPIDPPETAFISADGQLIEVSVATGEPLRIVSEEFEGDGLFRGGIRLMPDRESLWFSEGYEDGWYACASSIGGFGRIDLATGDISPAEEGSTPEPSANGVAVATLSSQTCLPDPDNEEFWVLTPYDRVIVYIVADGDSREFVTETPPTGYGADSAVVWAGFSTGGNLLVQTGDGQLRNVDISGPFVIQEHPVVLPEVLGAPVAATADALITLLIGDEGSSDLYSTDAVSGEVTFLASSETYMAVGVSVDEHIIVVSPTEVTVAPGAAVTVLPTDPDQFIFDIDW